MMKKAFSLIEVVIASGILVMVAGASLSLSNTVLKGNLALAQRTQAMYLATEGLETVQNIRDSNYVDEDPNTGWASGLLTGSYGVIFDGRRWSLGSNSNEAITLDQIVYSRTITISDAGAGKEVKVTVTWEDGTQKLELATLLTNSSLQL